MQTLDLRCMLIVVLMQCCRDMRDLIPLRRVNVTFRDVLASSKTLHGMLFLDYEKNVTCSKSTLESFRSRYLARPYEPLYDSFVEPGVVGEVSREPVKEPCSGFYGLECPLDNRCRGKGGTRPDLVIIVVESIVYSEKRRKRVGPRKGGEERAK